jgi:hypothetical protein
MKNLLLLLALLALMSSCRTLKKNKVQADSTVHRTEQLTANWEKVTVTEVFDITPPAPLLKGEGSVAHFDSVKQQPGKPGILQKLFKPRNKTVKLSNLQTKKVETPSLVTRTTTTERGTFAQEKQEQKQVHTAEKTKQVEAGFAVSKWVMPGAVILIISLLICLILIRSKQRDY